MTCQSMGYDTQMTMDASGLNVLFQNADLILSTYVYSSFVHRIFFWYFLLVKIFVAMTI